MFRAAVAARGNNDSALIASDDIDAAIAFKTDRQPVVSEIAGRL